MHKVSGIWAVLVCCGLLGGIVRADTFHLIDGKTVEGEVLNVREEGIVLKLTDGTYSDPVPWNKLSQADLKKLAEADPKAVQYAEPFIEVTREEKRERTDIPIKEPPRLERPKAHSLLGAMAGSTLGVFMLLLLYAGNLYAAYEVSIFRAQPAALVCGLSAVLPFAGPIVFLAIPTRLNFDRGEKEAPADEKLQAAIAAEEELSSDTTQMPAEARGTSPGAAPAHAPHASSAHPAKSFLRGQYTFNKRFFETQMPGFFAMVRPEAERDMELIVKSTRGLYTAYRISRISPNELRLQVMKGHASEEIAVPFVEIQEVHLKHKDA